MKDSLIDLPTEILSQLLAYLIPNGQSFRIKSRRSLTHNVEGSHSRFLNQEVDFYSWIDKESHDWSHGVGYRCPDALTVLLLHRSLHPIVLKQLYSSNTLWFPDLDTFGLFTDRFCTAIKGAIKTLAVDACGTQFATHGCAWSSTILEHPAQVGIANVVAEYPGLRDLRLGGVGPGHANLVDVSSLWADRSLTSINTISEPEELTIGNNFQVEELPGLPWSLDCIALVALIVGVASRRRNGSRDAAPIEFDDHRSEPKSSAHLLLNGKVFYHQPKDRGHDMYGPGRLRWAGTRITRREDNIQLSSREFEVTNIAKLLHQARLTHVDHMASLKHYMEMHCLQSESLAESQSNKRTRLEEKSSMDSAKRVKHSPVEEEEDWMEKWIQEPNETEGDS